MLSTYHLYVFTLLLVYSSIILHYDSRILHDTAGTMVHQQLCVHGDGEEEAEGEEGEGGDIGR